jgi:hypothetical protein
MALKDWKKVKTKWPGNTVFENVKDIKQHRAKGRISISDSNKDPWVMNLKGNNKVRVTLGIGSCTLGQPEFKTKQEALKFAKQYMRTH